MKLLSLVDLLSLALPLGALFVSTLMGTYRYRERIGKRWTSISMLVVGATGSMAICGMSGYLAYVSATYADSLRNPKPLPQVPANWAPNFSAADRTKYSRYFSEATFRERGETLKYIDRDGQYVAFVPRREDQIRRAEYLALISAVDSQSRAAAIAAALVVVLQALALILAKTPAAPWLNGLEDRLEQWRHSR